MHIYMQIHNDWYIYIYACIYVYACIWMYIYMYLYIYIYAYVYMYIYILIYIYMYTHIVLPAASAISLYCKFSSPPDTPWRGFPFFLDPKTNIYLIDFANRWAQHACTIINSGLGQRPWKILLSFFQKDLRFLVDWCSDFTRVLQSLWIWMCVSVWIRVCIWMCMCICMYVVIQRIQLSSCMHLCVCVCKWVCIFVCMWIWISVLLLHRVAMQRIHLSSWIWICVDVDEGMYVGMDADQHVSFYLSAKGLRKRAWCWDGGGRETAGCC